MTGTVLGLRKGLLVGTPMHIGQLCGETKGVHLYYDEERKRRQAKKLSWVSSQFVIRKEVTIPLPNELGSPLGTNSMDILNCSS